MPTRRSGWVGLVRAACPQCECYAFVIDDALQCCGILLSELALPPARRHRVSFRSKSRKAPPKLLQEKILAEQRNRCAYCEVLFGHWYWGVRKLEFVKAVWDHFVPYVVLGANPDDNWKAACRRCNGIKSDKIFKTVEDARDYIYRNGGWSYVSDMPERVRLYQERQKVLQRKVSVGTVEPKAP